MNPSFDVKFIINTDAKLLLTDTSAGSFEGFFKITYPDGVVRKFQDVPDYTNAGGEKEFNLRTKRGKLITGQYVIEQKTVIADDEYFSVKTFDFQFSPPDLLLKDNSAPTTPSVSFMDITDYSLDGYSHSVSRTISSKFPEQTGIAVTVTTPSIELFVSHNSNYYEGIYKPKLQSVVTYTSAQHSVEWHGSKSFEFDVRGFIGFDNIVTLINQVKQRLDEARGNNVNLQRDYFMITSLYVNITAKLAVGETDIADLVMEMQEVAKRLSCACCDGDYKYSPEPLKPYDPNDFFGGFPFIDQVIYREWNSEIEFSATSTVFHRVEGRIKWYKSRVNENIGNPIIIDGEINGEFWEPINDCCEYVTFRSEHIYEGGPQEFELPYTPQTIILVSANGYGPFMSRDYKLDGNKVTILPPNVLAEGTEVLIIATYDGSDVASNPGFTSISDAFGNIKFTSDTFSSIGFEGRDGIGIEFSGGKVIIKGGGSGVSGTYSELKVLADNSQLSPGGVYTLTDHATKHLIPNTNVIHTEPVEQLILTAITESEFDIEARSVTHPGHKLEYRFDLNVCEDGVTPRTGMIISRYDPDRNTYVGCDYLGVVQRRWKILDKVYREGSKIDDSNVRVVVPSNRPSLSNRTRHEVRFSTMTHPEGQINITLQYNNNNWVKPLVYHLDQEGAIPANYLSGKKGTIIYNPELDSFVLMGYIDIGADLIGTYSSVQPTNFSIGHGDISFVVDSNDFEDYRIFNSDYKNVEIKSSFGSAGTVDYYPNTVFKGIVSDFNVGGYLHKNTFNDVMSNIDISDYVSSSIFDGSIYEMNVTKLMYNVLFLKHVGSGGNVGYTFHRFYNCTMRPINNMFVGHYVNDTSFIFQSGCNFHLTGAFSESNIFMSGQNLDAGPLNGFYITGSGYRVLLGYVNSRYWIINKVLNNETVFSRNTDNDPENLLSYSKVDAMNLGQFLTPVGGIKLMGRDETGQVVDATHLLDGIVQPAEYTQPQIFLGSNQISTGREVGETVDAVLTATFFQNDAGTITNIKFYKDGVEVHSVNNPESPVVFTDEDITISTTPKVYTATIMYEEGPIKNNSLGNPSPEGHIEAGSLTSNTRNAVGTYIIAFGSTASIPTNSTEARTLTTVVRGTTNIRILDSGTVNTIQAIAVPPGDSLIEVIDLDASMQDLTIQYELIDNNFIINDAGNTPVPGYKLYARTQGVPYLTNHRHQFTIG